MKIALILNYQIRKRMIVLELSDESVDGWVMSSDVVKTKIRSVIGDYIQTESGKKFLEKNKMVIKLHDFLAINNLIPESIYNKYGIYVSSASEVDCVIELDAFLILLNEKKICATFNIYDEKYMIEEHEIKSILNRVNWSDMQYFRPLINSDGHLVGYGFLSDDIIKNDNENFSLKDFIDYAAKCAYEEYILEETIFENQGFRFVINRTD